MGVFHFGRATHEADRALCALAHRIRSGFAAGEITGNGGSPRVENRPSTPTRVIGCRGVVDRFVGRGLAPAVNIARFADVAGVHRTPLRKTITSRRGELCSPVLCLQANVPAMR